MLYAPFDFEFWHEKLQPLLYEVVDEGNGYHKFTAKYYVGGFQSEIIKDKVFCKLYPDDINFILLGGRLLVLHSEENTNSIFFHSLQMALMETFRRVVKNYRAYLCE